MFLSFVSVTMVSIAGGIAWLLSNKAYLEQSFQLHDILKP